MEKRSAMRIFLLLLMAVIIVAVHLTGVFDRFHDPGQIKTMLISSGAWGYGLYVVLFSLLQPLPAVAFIIPASMIWPKPVAFMLSIIGALGASILGFSFARFIARGWVENHLPQRFHRFDEKLAQHGLQTVIIVRFVFFLAPPAHWVLGLSKVGFGTFVLGSFLGMLPGVAAFTWIGGSFFDWLAGQPGWAWLVTAVFLAAGLVLRRARQKRISDSNRAAVGRVTPR
jgi:uncharacterized membrane protein YdjX (TVP38/TMEM64 family)